jgi:hypothetical protein
MKPHALPSTPMLTLTSWLALSLFGCAAPSQIPTPPAKPENPPAKGTPPPAPNPLPPPTEPPPKSSAMITIYATNPDGSPRSVRVISHGLWGMPMGSVDIAGRGTVAVVAGGAVTLVDTHTLYMSTWLEVQPGDELHDGIALSAPDGAPQGSAPPRAIDIANIADDVRFVRAKVEMHDGTTLLAAGELSATPAAHHADGTLPLGSGTPTATAQRTLIQYLADNGPEVPSLWGFDSTTPDAAASFDASGALPFVHDLKVFIDSSQRISVNWQTTAPVGNSAQLAKVLVAWQDPATNMLSLWDVRFPYHSDGVTLPPLPPEIAKARLPPPSTLINAEVALLDFGDAASSDVFRRDPSAWGFGPVGATRDLALGGAGCRRLSFITQF